MRRIPILLWVIVTLAIVMQPCQAEWIPPSVYYGYLTTDGGVPEVVEIVSTTSSA